MSNLRQELTKLGQCLVEISLSACNRLVSRKCSHTKCSHTKYAMCVKGVVDCVCNILVTKISNSFNMIMTRNVTRVWVESAQAFDLLSPNLGILLHVLEIRLVKWTLTRFPFTINSISVDFVQHWLRVAIVKGFPSFENEWFKVIVHPWGVRCVNANSPDGHQNVKPCVQHFAEYVKHQCGPQPEMDIWWRHPNFQHGAQTKGHDPGSLFSSSLRLEMTFCNSTLGAASLDDEEAHECEKNGNRWKLRVL